MEETAVVPLDFPLDAPTLFVGQWCTSAGRTVLVDDVAVWLTP